MIATLLGEQIRRRFKCYTRHPYCAGMSLIERRRDTERSPTAGPVRAQLSKILSSEFFTLEFADTAWTD